MAYGTSAGVELKGMRELQRALNKADRGRAKAVRDGLKEAAEPARVTAEHLAGARIAKIGADWGQMRIGTRTGSVYIAPRQRNRGGSRRPNLGSLLLDRAMFPALEVNERAIVRGVERALDRLLDRSGL